MQKQRRFRSKPSAPADEDDDSGPTIVTPAARKADAARKEKQAARKAEVIKQASLLSFDDDEDVAPTAAPNKVSRAAMPVAQSHEERSLGRASASSTQRSAIGEYSAERLQDLKAKTASIPGSLKPAAKSEPGGGFKLSGSFKAAKKPVDDRFEVNASDLVKPIRRKQVEEVPFLPPPPRSAKQETAPAVAAAAPAVAASSAPAPDSDDEAANGFAIPTKEAIRRAKEKRERLRSAHLAPDYIPLGGAAALTSNKGAAARLRGEPAAAGSPSSAGRNSDSEGEAEPGADMRMKFVGGQPERQRNGGGVFTSDAHDDGDDEDDEDDAWVQQQLQKAGAASLPQAQPPADSRREPAMHTPAARQAVENPAAQAAAAGQSVMASLQDGLRHLQERQQNVERQRKQTEANLADSLRTVETLQRDVDATSHRYTYLQETRTFISDMCDMLQEKAPIVEVLEERLAAAAAERASAFATETAANDAEELNAAQAAIGAAIGVLSRDGKAPAAAAAAAAAAEAADAAAVHDLPEELDEFGRDLNVEKRRDAEERMQKRKQRAAAGSAAEAQVDGASSDEEGGEVARHHRERSQILEAAATVFADTSDEFSSVEAIKKRLLDWQTSYPGTYRDAYMAVSAPAIFAPFVRLQLLRWDPLHEPAASGFEHQEWYQQLFDFGAPPDAGSGDEADVVPVLIRDVVTPLALGAAEKVWNPTSRAQTRGMAAVVENLLIYVPPEDQNLQALLKLVRRRLGEAAARVEVPRWPGEALAASPRAAALVARQFSRAVRLLYAVGRFEQVLDRGALRQLAVDQLLLPKIVPHLRAATNDLRRATALAEAAVGALPASWRGGLPAEAAPLQALVADLHRRADSASRSNPEIVQRLTGLLGNIGSRPA